MPRLDCRYQSLSQHAWELCRFPTLLARYGSTALSAIVALTSTPTRTKQPQPADLVPPSTNYYVRTPPIPPQVAGSASGTPLRCAKQWYRTCTAFCAFLISMPLPAQAYATTRRGQTFHQAHILVPKQPACQNTPFCALESSRTMQAPVALAGQDIHHTCAFSRSAYARCGLQARRMPCLCFAATDPQASIQLPPQLHCGQQAGNDLHAAAFPYYRQWSTRPLHSRAAVLPSVVLEVMLTRNKRTQQNTKRL